MHNKILVIALDGATFSLLSPLMQADKLPALQKLKSEGLAAGMQSIFPPLTAPAWASFMTGVNPGKHGIYEFLRRDRKSHRRLPVSANHLGAETLWSRLSKHGKRLGVMNVPLTYPPAPVNGFILGDFLTPAGARDFTYPRNLLQEVEGRHGSYPLYVRQVYYPGNVANVLKELNYFQSYYERVALDLLQKEPWDFFMVHFAGLDRIQHELWHILDPEHPLGSARERRAFRGQVLAFYQRTDESVGKLVQAAGDEYTIIVMSDHGFGPIHNFVVLPRLVGER
ncbi:MAG: alkaline phosphatase family protein [Pseudomonadota bacterium]